jgi:hypothetical protein
MSNHSASPSQPPDAGPEAAPLAWLLALLREAILGVMAVDAPALKKANALARLGSLYLKTYNTAELVRVNSELVEGVAELEEPLTALEVEAAAGEEAAAGPATTEPDGSLGMVAKEKRKSSQPHSHDRKRPARHHSKPSPRGKASGRGGRGRAPHG